MPAVRADLERLQTSVTAMRLKEDVRQDPVTGALPVDRDLDKRLLESLDLEVLIEAALARNPALRAAVARSEAALEEVNRAGSLDDPALKAEAWGVPLHQPVSFNRDDTNMFGLMQTFPFPGKLGLKAESALREAEATHQVSRERERDVIAELKRAYFSYFMLSKELEVHIEHVRLLEDLEKISEEKFKNGIAPQQDPLKAQVELVMLHNDVLFLEQRIGSAKAAINVLLSRPDGAPLGKPKEISLAGERYSLEELQEKALTARPELQAAKLKREASLLSQKLAERDALLPDITLGIDYWQQPDRSDAWGGLVSINLPWFTGKRAAEARKLRHLARAEAIGLEQDQNRVLYEVRDAFLRVEATRRSVVLIQGELLPKSQQSVDVTRSGYETTKASFQELLEAERSQRNVRISYYRALSEYESAVADLERAIGSSLRQKP
jgi:outer membrane protein TolC